MVVVVDANVRGGRTIKSVVEIEWRDVVERWKAKEIEIDGICGTRLSVDGSVSELCLHFRWLVTSKLKVATIAATDFRRSCPAPDGIFQALSGRLASARWRERPLYFSYVVVAAGSTQLYYVSFGPSTRHLTVDN